MGISKIPMAVLSERKGVVSTRESCLEIAQHGVEPAIRFDLSSRLAARRLYDPMADSIAVEHFKAHQSVGGHVAVGRQRNLVPVTEGVRP